MEGGSCRPREAHGPRTSLLYARAGVENIERYGVEIIADEVNFLTRAKPHGDQGQAINTDLDDDLPN